MTAFKMEGALNAHVQEEIYSSYLYLSMAAYCHDLGFNGFAHWLKIQSKEEWGHAMKLYDFIIERGGRVLLNEIKKPPHDFKSIHAMVQQVLGHEQKVTAELGKLYEESGKSKDHASQIMLQWFVQEQVEEEASVNEILQKLKLVGEKSSSILYLDKEMKKREG